MVWPSPVYPGNPIFASQFNGMLSAFSTWADSVNALLAVSPGSGSFIAPITFAGNVTFGVAPTFADPATTRANLGLPAITAIASLSTSNLFQAAGAITQTVSSTTSTGTAGFQLRNDNSNTLLAQMIGSTNPSSIAGVAVANWALLYSSSFSGFLIGTTGASPLVFAAGNAERARFVSAGRFLLGTTTDDGSTLLQVAGGASFSGAVAHNGAASFAVAPTFTDPATTRTNLGVPSLSGSNTFTSAASITNSVISTLTTGTAVTLSQNNLGNQLALEMVGSAFVGTLAGITIGNWAVLYSAGASGLMAVTLGNVPLVFATSSLERARFVGAGRFLLGTTTDDGSTLLQVAGGASFSGAVAHNGAASFAVAPTFTDAATTRTNLSVPGLNTSNSFGGSNTFAGSSTTFNSVTVTIANGLTAAGASFSGTVSFTGALNGTANANFSGSWTHSGSTSFTGAVSIGAGFTVVTPANIVFGSNWLSWTPTVSPTGSLTVSGVSIGFANYLQVGPYCEVEASITFTTGGTPAIAIQLTLPLAYKGAAALYFPQATFGSTGVATVSPGIVALATNSNILTVYAGSDTTTNWSGGAKSVFLKFSYRVQ